jgi:hypothetical protein
MGWSGECFSGGEVMDTINHVDAELLKDVRIDMHHAETITDYSREEEDEALRTHDALMRELEICRIRVEHAHRRSQGQNVAHRPADLSLVFKTKPNAKELLNGETEPLTLDMSDDAGPLTNDELIDGMAEALAEVRAEMRADCEQAIANATAPLLQRISKLEGQMSMLMTMMSGESRSLEASETVQQVASN